jgi:dolichyl-phosphate-mannose-protein mannosyltransferase
MQASDNFRSRRPPSPHGPRQTLTTGLPTATARFPQPRYVEEGTYVMSADEKLDAVRQDGQHPGSSSSMFSRAFGPSGPGRGSFGARLGGGLGKMTSGEWKVLIAVVVVAWFVRLYRISKPNSVVFDEVHFGKFAGKYIKVCRRYLVLPFPPSSFIYSI